MKKIFALILALCMVFSLAACGGGSTPANNAANTTPANNSANTPTNNTANTEEAYRGKVTGNTYVNEPLDLKLTLPSGWTIFNDEQIAQQQGVTKEFFEGTSIEKIVDSTGSMMVFYAMKGAGINNLNIIMRGVKCLN